MMEMLNERDAARPVRVLVVDDSRLLRRGIRAILEASGIVVVGECANGIDALAKIKSLAPDVVTVDLDMPELNGLETVERIMAAQPTPILIVTGDARFGGLDNHFEALMRGAVDLICKPSSVDPKAPDSVRLVERIRTVARVSVAPAAPRPALRRREHTTAPLTPIATARMLGHTPPALITIGASTGGPGALRTLLGGLGSDLSVPVVVVQHMAEEFAEGFVTWLRSQVAIPIQEATIGTRVRAGHAYIAVRGPHIRIGADGVIGAAPGPPNPHRPSIDVLFSSAASSWGKRSIGILLTGMGADGANGLAAIHSTGGLTIAQDEDSSVVFGMPGAAIERGAARLILALHSIARVTRDACVSPSADRSQP
jgi:two-component system, chemotaxis family, protein-glutamate methylesterase/glutaminase